MKSLFPNSVQSLAVNTWNLIMIPQSLFRDAKMVQCVYLLFWGKECKSM